MLLHAIWMCVKRSLVRSFVHTNKSGINAFYNRLTYQKWAKISPRAIVLSKIMASLEQATHAVHREPLFILIIHIHIKWLLAFAAALWVRARWQMAVVHVLLWIITIGKGSKSIENAFFTSLSLPLLHSLHCIPSPFFPFNYFSEPKISVFIFVFQRCFNISLVKTHTKGIKIFHMNGYSFSLCKYLLLMNRQLNEPRKMEYFARVRAVSMLLSYTNIQGCMYQ